ncbi:MAG: cytochrome c3 family protein [Nitrospirota bacterium]
MFKAFKEGLTIKAVAALAAVVLILLSAGGYGAYRLWDYKENNPSFCTGCHLMSEAFHKWSVSEHKGVNCHECHHLTLMEQNQLMVSLVLHNPKVVPARHGKVIVPWEYCVKCHWETNPKYPNAPNISDSPVHAKHFFSEKLECSGCHGYRLHQFTVEPRFCVKCHPHNAEVHGMEGMACLACHTDKTASLKPNRDKCLTCHGNDEQRARIAAEPKTVDTRHFTATADEIAIASKLTTFPADGAMKFDCNMCHKPHGKLKLSAPADCLPCHRNIMTTGKHAAHLSMGLKCFDCHKAHLWKVTKEMGKSAKCTQCHGPVDPANFLL